MAAPTANLHTLVAIFDDDDLEAVSCAIRAATSATALAYLEYCREPHNSAARVRRFVTDRVPRYTNSQFREHFRMRIDVFEELLQWIAPLLPKERAVSSETNLLATLWFIGHQESYRSVADRFGLSSAGSLRRVMMRVCKVLVDWQKEWICWPSTTAEMERLAKQFEERCHFPGVIAAINGTRIQIPKPSLFPDAYIDCTGNPSMQLQVACSNDLLFLDVFTGWPGSVHDARIFKNSPLESKLREEIVLDRRFHLIGDSAYPLSTYLLVPFRDDGHLDDVRKKFNEALLVTRAEVERAIRLLKGKWRKLRFLEMTNVEDMPEVIVSACVLHNFAILKNDVEVDDMITVIQPEQDANEEPPLQSAVDKRMEIAYQLAQVTH